MPNTLLHCCCAPCSVRCIEDLRGEGIEPTAYWYNPTIHPYQEYKARRDTLVSYAPTISMTLVVDEDYGLRPFVQAVAADIDHRCRYCYACRLDRTARYAAENGFDSFSTTLLISPYQDHELIRTCLLYTSPLNLYCIPSADQRKEQQYTALLQSNPGSRRSDPTQL